MDMIDKINIAARSDPELAGLYERAKDYARMYLYIKKRQKGCDGIGELNNLKDEATEALKELIGYCADKGVISGPFAFDIDLMVENF